ncbi:DUF6944 family repetitive protein [Gottfriedia luciferensis]|uniref:DUF6944 family repetitive protein n=1 Tax=Gottfriedia luciferensis TaxID=178774 RepID=UPI000B44E7A4|nr:hypothetical protein [Gottfriedia luciferensis]
MSQLMEVIGAWVNAIGTISSAISSTPMRGLKGDERKSWEEISFHLDFGGNTFQAIGNIIEAFLGEPSVIEDAGEIIQASGNVTVLFSLLSAEEDEENVDRSIKLNMTGNAQQAFGGLIAALEEVSKEDFDVSGFMGNFLQSIGNTLQVMSGVVELEIEDLKDYLKETEQTVTPGEEPSDFSSGIIFNELQEYPGRIQEKEASELPDDYIYNESEYQNDGIQEGSISESFNEVEDDKTIEPNSDTQEDEVTKPTEEKVYEIEDLFGRIPDYEPSELLDDPTISQAGEPSDLSDGIIFNELQEYNEETETNPLVKEYEELALLLKYSGSWIQAAGSIVSVYSEQKELFKPDEEQDADSEQNEIVEKKNVKRKKKTNGNSTEDRFESTQKKSNNQEYTIFKKKS